MANKKPIPVESTKHKDKRVNIPTEELRNFVREDELTPKTMLYPRDPSLDPQLVWKGKDEQDKEDLAVPTVPVYIQEKIHPQALIENLRETAKAGEAEPEVWEFHIGGYQALDKWLKDRKGRKLTWEDQQHYQKIVVALKETMRIMREIDEVIPSWPIQ